MFSKEQKPLGLLTINTKFSWKRVFPAQKSRSIYRRCSVKEGLQLYQKETPVLRSFYEHLFWKTYMWSAASKNLQWQIYRREVIPEFFYPFKLFSIQGFSVNVLFSLEHDNFIINNTTSFITHGSRKIAPEENCPPALILTLILNQTLTQTGGQFSSEAIFRTA